MVHRLTQNRPFMVALAVVMLLALMPWQGALHCQGGSAGTDGPCCCCCPTKATTPTDACCCVPGAPDPKDPDPEDPGPCPCIQVGMAVGLPAVVGPQGDEGAAVALHLATELGVAENSSAGGMRAPLPRARTGPGLHLRLQVLLI